MRFRWEFLDGGAVSPNEIEDSGTVEVGVTGDFGHLQTAGPAKIATGGDDSYDVVAIVNLDILHDRILKEAVKVCFVVDFGF